MKQTTPNPRLVNEWIRIFSNDAGITPDMVKEFVMSNYR